MSELQTSIKKRVRAVILLASAIVLFVTAAAFVTYEATDIDEGGRIVGYGRYADGRTAAYLLVPIESGGN